MRIPRTRILILSFLLVIVLAGSRLPVAVAQNSLGIDTLNVLRRTPIPPRDPVDLAHRFLGLTQMPKPQPAPSYKIGDSATFTADNSDQNVQFTLTAQLLYATPHVYMWFETSFKPDMDAVKRAADDFENHIYPTVHTYFGTEASPGVDNDVHLYILHAHNLGASIGGYFGGSSTFPKAVVPGSNEHEMFFVNLDTVGSRIGMPDYEGILAHEFQHMVHSNLDYNEDAWLNEGLSELSALLNGYVGLGFAPRFTSAPDTQLNTWPADTDTSPHYGASFLFVTYFLQRYGEDALRSLMTDPLNGLESIADILKKNNAVDPATNKPITVEDLFADWTMATLLDDQKAGDGRYYYSLLKSPLPTPAMTEITADGSSHTLTPTQWGTTYLDIRGSGSYQLTFQGQPTVKVVPADAHSGKMMWWSNRGDQSDMRLTHAFDLTAVQKATLSFWLWHQIEKDWDYGYVAVSTDNGSTWNALSTQDTAPAGGHNNPYGPGYTGASGGGVSAIWEHETADLTPYAGKKILVRFEYLTDDEVDLEGMLIDDISIPELNYSTDAETGDDGWVAEGWARIENVLPERYLVQMAEYGKTTRVFRLLGPDDGSQGKWTLNVGGDVTHLVVSVSGLTEFTTEQASVQYVLEGSKP